MKKILIGLLSIVTVSASANVVCQTAKTDRKNPAKYIERCYLGQHNVQISNRAEATAFVNECRLNKRNGDVVKLTSIDNKVSDIQLTVRGVDFGLVPKLKSTDQFGLAISTLDIGDGELIECATVIGGFSKNLKY